MCRVAVQVFAHAGLCKGFGWLAWRHSVLTFNQTQAILFFYTLGRRPMVPRSTSVRKAVRIPSIMIHVGTATRISSICRGDV